jgi:hypothetical protein
MLANVKNPSKHDGAYSYRSRARKQQHISFNSIAMSAILRLGEIVRMLSPTL